MQHKSNKAIGLRWDSPITVLTNALTRAIADEIRNRKDALVAAEIVHYAIRMDLNAWFDLSQHQTKVVPLRRPENH